MAIGFQWLNKHGTPKGSQDAAVEEKRIELVDKESQTESCVIYAPLETRVIDPTGVDGAIEDFYQSLQKWVDREQLKLQAAEAENEQIHETMQLVMQKLRAYQDQYACNQPIPADAKLDTEALPMFLEGVLKDARNLDRIRLALAELMQNRFDEELAVSSVKKVPASGVEHKTLLLQNHRPTATPLMQVQGSHARGQRWIGHRS
eukprot:GEMP01082986.1.p1 GENE.GEMP01082986.1~~GEMP01082986.1.p1  ORF type:complete len:204 (+),score=36.00 GEMP01082986.1:22-633(+)